MRESVPARLAPKCAAHGPVFLLIALPIRHANVIDHDQIDIADRTNAGIGHAGRDSVLWERPRSSFTRSRRSSDTITICDPSPASRIIAAPVLCHGSRCRPRIDHLTRNLAATSMMENRSEQFSGDNFIGSHDEPVWGHLAKHSWNACTAAPPCVNPRSAHKTPGLPRIAYSVP